jgi:hypothetical protein
MEHEALKDKLESVDLDSIHNLHWDQERTWHRLNTQLETTAVKKIPIWKYGIAACIFFIVAVGVGYLMIYRSNSKEHLFPSRNIIAGSSTDPVEKNISQSIESKPEINTDQVQPFTSIIEETKVKPAATRQITVIKSPIDKSTEVEIVATVEQEEFTLVEEKSKTALNDHTALPKSFKKETKYEVIEGLGEVTTQVIPTTLSSQPITKNKKGFSIRLFQKKNKQTARNVHKVAALTLFTRN